MAIGFFLFVTIEEPAKENVSQKEQNFKLFVKNAINILFGEYDIIVKIEAEDSEKDINLYVNSPGGSVTAGLAIYDTMRYIKPDVSTICVGMAASMGAILLAGGTEGKRSALPNAKIMIHQPWVGGLQGQTTDIEIHAKEMLKTRDTLYNILVKHTGKTMEQITKDCDRDYFLTSEEAKEYHLIDNILETRAVTDKK